MTSTAPRLDSLDRPGKPEVVKPAAKVPDDALADTANQTPDLRKRNSEELALVSTAPVDAIEPETRAFVEDAKTALADAAKDLATAPEPVPVEPTPVARKRAATRAHASQIGEEHFMLSMPDEAFEAVFGTEWFIRDGQGPGITETAVI